MKRAQKNGAGISRRDAIKLGAAGSLMAGRLFAAAPSGATPGVSRIKSIIQVWLWGGPCHLDTFDPKPNAGSDFTGRLDKEVETNVSGIRINAALPQLAQLADRYALVRGMTHGNNGHETASYMVMSGWNQGDGLVHPSIGAIVSWFKGYRAGYTGLIPPYVALTRAQGRFSEAGFLGQSYQPFATGGDPARDPFAVEGVVLSGVSEQRQQSRRDLLGQLDTFSRSIPEHPLVQQAVSNREDAYSLILGEARGTFDLKSEPDELRASYGRSTFGQSCLVARKLAEAGVPFITINAPRWDTHKKHFELMGQMLPELDRGLSTLIRDLEERGMLDSTLVWCGGEFGRTPRVDWDPPWSGGRGHHGRAFTHLLAGGGFKGGMVVGATSARGEEVTERPVYPWDMAASILGQMGIGLDAELPLPDGGRCPVSPLAASSTMKVPSGGMLRELLG